MYTTTMLSLPHKTSYRTGRALTVVSTFIAAILGMTIGASVLFSESQWWRNRQPAWQLTPLPAASSLPQAPLRFLEAESSTQQLPRRTAHRRGPSNHHNVRSLQAVSATVTYWTNYTVEFQTTTTIEQPKDKENCTLDPSLQQKRLQHPPTITLHLYCQGPNIDVISTSHPDSTVCDFDKAFVDDFGWINVACSAVACPKDENGVSNCNYQESDDNDDNVDDATSIPNFQSIQFSCGGPSWTDIEGGATLMESSLEVAVVQGVNSNSTNEDKNNDRDSNNESISTVCTENTISSFSVSHTVRLGVYCPIGAEDDPASALIPAVANSNDNGNDNTRFDYTFEDSYAECAPFFAASKGRSGHSSTTGTNLTATATTSSAYQCTTRLDCDNDSCWNYEGQSSSTIASVAVESTAAHFQHRCIQASARVPYPPRYDVASSQSNAEVSSQNSQYTTRFEASWSLLFTPRSDTTCSGYIPPVTMQCIDGDIQFVSSIFDSMNCTYVDEDDTSSSSSTLACLDTNPASAMNAFVSVVYDCVGPVLPQTIVRFAEQDAFCDGNAVETTVAHAVQLGIHCTAIEDDTAMETFHTDLFFDCVNASPDFDFLDEFGMVSSDDMSKLRYTCSESTTFGAGSTESTLQRIPSLAISTDLYWAKAPNERCYSLVVSNNSTTTDTAMEVESASPIPSTPPGASPQPVPTPSFSPVAGTVTTTAPSAQRMAAPSAAASQTQSSSDSLSSNLLVGIVVGGIVALIVLASAILFAVITRRNHGGTGTGSKHGNGDRNNAPKPAAPNPVGLDSSETAQNSVAGRSSDNQSSSREDSEGTDLLREPNVHRVQRYMASPPGHQPPIYSGHQNPDTVVVSTYAVPVFVENVAEVVHAEHEPFPALRAIHSDRPVEFKDQARSVQQHEDVFVPIANVQAIPDVQPIEPIQADNIPSSDIPLGDIPTTVLARIRANPNEMSTTDLSSIIPSMASEDHTANQNKPVWRETVEL